MRKKSQLAFSVATAALITGLATPAQAGCTVDGSTVTCTADSTSAEVNAAMALVDGDDVTLNIETDANVVQPGGDVSPIQQGEVAIENSGDVGVNAAPVGVFYVGTPTEAGNTFSLDNIGSITGQVSVFNVGGALDIDNSGLLAGGVFVSTEGAVSLNSSGQIDSAGSQAVYLASRTSADAVFNGDVGDAATATTDSDLRDSSIRSRSFRSEPLTTETETVGGVTTTTTTSGYTYEGGTASASVGAGANTGSIVVAGLGGASVDVNGAVGSDTEFDRVLAFSNLQEGSTVTVSQTDGTDSSFVQIDTQTAIGSTASVTVGETGSVSGNVEANGLASADVDIAGAVGNKSFFSNVSARSENSNFTQVNASSTTGTVSESSFAQTGESVGGTASATVSETGSVTGGVTARGFAGADVSVDGSVGTADNPSFVSASSSGTTSTFVQENTFDSDTGASTFAQTSTNSSTGSDASIVIGETGVANGTVDAFANGDARVSNAGTISGPFFANASGSDSSNGFTSSSDGMGNSQTSSFSASTSTGGSASIENAAGGLIGLDATSPVSVNAFGNTAASVTNSGRINGDVNVAASGSASESTDRSSFTTMTDAATGITTSVSESVRANSTTNLGGDASFANLSGAIVTGRVDVNGAGSAEVVNEGAVIGQTSASSRATDTTFLETIVTTTVFVPGADGGTSTTRELQRDQAQVSSGGDVTGLYSGTNGAVQFAPFGGASDGSVFQSANGNSSAIVSGTIFGNFSGVASGSEFVSTFSDSQVRTFDADGDQRTFDREYAYAESNRQSDSDSSLIVDGGEITGDAFVFGTGSASVQVANGGMIGGDLNATAQAFGGYDYSQTYDLEQTFDEDGVFVSSNLTQIISETAFVNDGDVNVAIDSGMVGGSIFMNGAAGINSFSLGADSSVGGVVSQSSRYSARSYDQTFTSTSTATGSVSSFDYAETRTASGGDVDATVAGMIGNGIMEAQGYGDIADAAGSSLSLSTDAGNAQALITGQVRNGIDIIASGNDSSFAFQEERENGLVVGYSEQSSSVATGGTATLVVDADNRDLPANFGDILVRGRSGSSASIGSDSSVLAATNGATMLVGGYFFDTNSTRDDEYTAGVLTGQTTTFDATGTGGASSLTNAGRIGYDGGAAFDGNSASVAVVSATEATALNDGQVFGSIGVFSIYEDLSTTTTRANVGDVTQVDTTTTTYSATGGTAALTNNGLITGNASLAAIDGALANNGVIRGHVSLGASVDNYTTQSVDTLTQLGEEEVFYLTEAIEQGYAVEQNGLLGGTIFVEGAFGNIDGSVRTSDITADIALNSGSVTGGGVIAEYDEETGERFTETNVSLNGAGYLGLGSAALTQLGDSFGDVDPGIEGAGNLMAFAGGARVLGVETLTKTGAGVFLITGAAFEPTSNTNTVADYTLDLGTFAINGGEIQLATIGDDSVFGLRGDLVNSAGLVLGSRVSLPAPLFGTNASITAIDGVQVYQNGNYTQSSTGTLSVGVTPTLVRVADPRFSNTSTSTNPLAVQTIGLASGLFTTPENAFGQAFTNLGTGFLTVDGNMNLAGTVQLVSPTGGLFTDGQTVDIASVSGTVTTSANVAVNSPSNFVTFDLDTRTEGGRTIVFASADRVGFETAGDNQNAVAAGSALTAAFPDVIARIQAGSNGGIGANGDQFVLAQDLANIFVGFDSLLTMEQVGTALNELASGEFYGSLTTLETTAPFVDAISSRRVPAGASGFNLWLAPSGDFAELEGDTAIGSRTLESSNYGGSVGFGIATGNGEIGLGVGLGRIEANSESDLLMADADTVMVGAYARQAFGNFSIGADLVYGWSDWNASRVMPTLSREAFAEFDSTELRGNLRVEYMAEFGGAWVAPFGQLSFRRFNLEGFTEEGAGAVNLIVEEASDTVLTPTLGLRAGTRFDTGLATLRPEVTLAYSFDDDNSSFRDVAYLGAASNTFRLQGVDPEGYFTIGAGLFADIGTNSGAFLRGSYATGSNLDVASVNAGVTIGF